MKSIFIALTALALLTGQLIAPSLLPAAEILPPGQRPQPLGAHALMGARVIVKPGTALEGATILIRNGRIEAVLPAGKKGIPADARVWSMKGKTIYAGFIDPYLSLGEDKAKPISNRWTVPIDARAGVSFTGLPTTKTDMGRKGPGYEIAGVRPEHRVAAQFSPDPKELVTLRALGFTAANVIPTKGIYRGTGTLALLGTGNPNQLILKPDTVQHLAFSTTGERAEGYPNSLMGAIAVIRQTVFDAQHYFAMQSWHKTHPTDARPEYNPSLEALRPVLAKAYKQRIIIEPGSVLMLSRAQVLSAELGFDPILVATGQEWRRPEMLKQIKAAFIVPVVFPAIPELPEEEDWNQISLDQLRAWDWAPEIPALLRRDHAITLTTHGLADYKSFRKNIARAIERGLTEQQALAALTTEPARLMSADKQIGTIEKGKLANLTVVDGGSWFDPDNEIDSVWIEGRHFINDNPASKKSDTKPKNGMVGKGKEKTKPSPRIAQSPDAFRGPLLSPKNVIIQNATIWTCGPEGVITNGSIRIANGRIAEVGRALNPPESFDGIVIGAKGMHVTPGLIDCHSHSMILGGVNEGTLPSTAMVRIGDVVNSETGNIYRQLAGGLTTANLLHGSANPIGGQNQVIKLRHGAPPDALKFANAPAGIKFALGENVKQSNWGDDKTTRFPQTRMGVKTFFNNRFTAARQYLADQLREDVAPIRRNLELEAIGEIINGKRLIHCHSYRQDEILIFIRTMERFGVKIGTLQHVLEGYKIADEIAAHGAGASTFSDWWAYKFEVYDAIPYAGSLMHARGALVSFNSDSSDLARRLNLEAAKAVKYGGTSEEDALKFVTLNPAKQLRIDQWVGSLEVGKDADIVLWSGHPLSTQTICEQTWIEGAQYYDRAKAAARTKTLAAERTALLAKARKNNGKENAGVAARSAFFFRALEKAHALNNCYECRKVKP
ncbi:MAG: amidohydrolase family protein [Verrucomicrobia subdivision 3 bacterium]|nr:amidohydrolase family protein [Limisphaerales bacterium]